MHSLFPFLGATKEPLIAFAFPFFRRDEGGAYSFRFSRFSGTTKELPIVFAFPGFRRDEGAAYCIRLSRFFFRATYSPLLQLPRSVEDFDYKAPKDAS